MSIAHGTVGLAVTLTIEKISPTTRLKDLDYHLVWTERAALSRTGDFRIIPEDTIPPNLTPDARENMLRAIMTERTFMNKH